MNFSPDLKSLLAQMNSALGLNNVEDRTQYYSLLMAGVCIAIVSLPRLFKNRKLEVNVPIEGSSGVVSSYIDAYDFIANARSVLKRAYEKYGHGTFKIPEMSRYTVIINKRDVIEEIRKAPDSKASFDAAMAEVNQGLPRKYCIPIAAIFSQDFAFRWTLGENLIKDTYHITTVRNQLTRSLGLLFDDVRDEIMRAFHDLIPVKIDDWVAFPALDMVRNIVCRASNRIFVGVPLCRNPEFIDLSINFTIDIMKTVFMIQDTPVFLRPIVGAYFSPTARSVRQAMKFLRPLFEERFRMYDENGDDWQGKPADMISWLIDEAPVNEKRSVRDLTTRMLAINFAAMHTSSNSFTHALFHLAAEPHYIPPLREEIEQVIKEEGWSKIAMTKMWKLDSFMKESQRINGINLLSLNRKIMCDLTLPDGTFLPAGTFVAANLVGAHRDDSHYPDADRFDGFRFSKLREQSSEEGVKHQMVNTSPEYLAFGHGRHACPGRFFAVNELKAMMAYLILNYDVKTEVEGVRPENVYHRARLSPNPKAKVLFKKRTDA
ncbi:cytochrome P450 [Fomitiporia mediterranea MF3/22]|uniref:cytochrome P450 n=1 Tax=Fomitiporia mediterranea (strain MF3/22) TaxID=694068 RepID=UPI0004409AE2|nr:cytochrome P450 [Fomitiporia mediterranea MF3/22]EJD07489.1 cytochrome P450 [Fomitiporia mediterranea MF3/22]